MIKSKREGKKEDIVTDALKYKEETLSNLINEILNQPITLENLLVDFSYDTLISKPISDMFVKRALTSVNRYMVKRGTQYLEQYDRERAIKEKEKLEERLYENFYLREVLDYILHLILGYFGVPSSRYLLYRTLSFSIWSVAKKQAPRNLPHILEEKIKTWVMTKEANEDIAKVVAVVTARIVLQYMREKAML
jgi:hypothetical protein